MRDVQLYVDGCDVTFAPGRAENVRANLAAVAGRTYLLRPGDTGSLGPAPVLDGRGCLALRVAEAGAWGAVPPPGGPSGAVAALLADLERMVRAGLTPGQAMALRLPGGGGLAEGAPADWWLVPGGPLADVRALARPRHVVEGGRRVGGA